MKNNTRKKFIVGLMLTAFLTANSITASLANTYANQPVLRSTSAGKTTSLRSNVHINNGDTRVNISLRDADVTQVLRMFADQAGMNIIFTSGVEGTVTMDLVDISVEQALNLVIATSKLFYDIDGNTIVVSSSEDALSLSDRSQVTVIPIKYANAAAVAHFINVNFFGKRDSKRTNPGISQKSAVVANPISNEIIIAGTEYDVALVRGLLEQIDKKPAITTYKVNHTTPAEMANAICTSLIPGAMYVGTSESTGGAAGVPTGGASDSSESGNISVSGGKLACSFAAVNSDDFDDDSDDDDDDDKLISFPSMGMTVTYFPSLGTVQIIGGSEQQIAMIGDYIEANDKKTPQAYLEVQIVTLSESGSKTLNNEWTFYSKNFSFNAGKNGFSTSSMYPIFFAGHGIRYVDPSKWTDHGYETTGVAGKWSFSPTLIYSINYLIENKKARVLANPKVLVTNGETTVIDLTQEYLDSVTTQYLDNGSMSAQVQRTISKGTDKGIKVEVSAFISPDGYLSMDIKPQYNDIYDAYDVINGNNTDRLASFLQKRELDLKGVRIKDGETLVIGGLIQETETKSVNKIPFLGDIPVLGTFFRSTATNKEKQELVIMITPQIIVDTEDAVSKDIAL